MILSHKLKCIYIKKAKVGGTSFELALSRFCGADDVITYLGAEEEKLRPGKYGTQNCFHIDMKADEKADMKLRGKAKGGRYPNYFFYKGAGRHMTAGKVKREIPQKLWDNYLKVAIVRSPYDVAISRYYFQGYKGGFVRQVIF